MKNKKYLFLSSLLFLLGLGVSVNFASAQNSATVGSLEFTNPLVCTTVSCVVGAILNTLLNVVALIAIVFIVIGGIMYMTAGGNEKTVERAKATITGAVVGFAIAIAAPTFLKQIKETLGGGSGADANAMINGALTIKDVAIQVLNFLLSVVGIIAIISLIVGGIMYLTSYGDEERIEKAKTMVTYSIIGIVIAFGAVVIVTQISKLITAQ